MRRVPLFPLTEPDQWDEYTLLAANILLEAEGEPPDGNDGVAHVVMSRHRIWNRPIHNVILGLDGKSDDIYEPFSCWNSDYRTRALTRLAAADDQPLITAFLSQPPADKKDPWRNFAILVLGREGNLHDW